MTDKLSRGIISSLLAAFFFSIMGALVKYSASEVPVMQVVFYRTVINLFLLIPYMAAKKISFFGNHKRLLLTRSIAGFVALCLGFFATSHLKLADASILGETSVVFVALLSALVLGERLSTKLWVLIFTSLCGAALIIKPTFNFINVAGLVALAGGFMRAVAYISMKRLHDTENSFTIIFNFCFYSTFFSLILFGSTFEATRLGIWFALLIMGTCGTIGQIFLTYGYRYAPASIAAPLSFCGVLFSAFWGALVWGELPDVVSLIGTGVVIASGVAIIRLSHAEAGVEKEAAT